MSSAARTGLVQNAIAESAKSNTRYRTTSPAIAAPYWRQHTAKPAHEKARPIRRPEAGIRTQRHARPLGRQVSALPMAGPQMINSIPVARLVRPRSVLSSPEMARQWEGAYAE